MLLSLVLCFSTKYCDRLKKRLSKVIRLDDGVKQGLIITVKFLENKLVRRKIKVGRRMTMPKNRLDQDVRCFWSFYRCYFLRRFSNCLCLFLYWVARPHYRYSKVSPKFYCLRRIVLIGRYVEGIIVLL